LPPIWCPIRACDALKAEFGRRWSMTGLFDILKEADLHIGFTAAFVTAAARDTRVWGEGTTACASDSKHFAAFDQNLMTEWHARYSGRGVMIYWHVERGSVCIHSRLRRCSSSEVAAMIEGVLRHDTEMEVERQYVDSHGQSEVAFAFCRLLGFQLLSRLKAIAAQRLHLPGAGTLRAWRRGRPSPWTTWWRSAPSASPRSSSNSRRATPRSSGACAWSWPRSPAATPSPPRSASASPP
jgi:hypothetical protein